MKHGRLRDALRGRRGSLPEAHTMRDHESLLPRAGVLRQEAARAIREVSRCRYPERHRVVAIDVAR